jgi:uncharacterized protein YceK
MNMTIDRKKWVTAAAGILLALTLTVSGCANMKSSTTTQSSVQKKNEKVPIYYDFGDVLVPSELKLDKKSSFVFQTPAATAGVLSLKGRVDASSLITFFETNMVQDNWESVSSFKSIRTIMLWKKDTRWCVINISEENLYTYVEIWVAPTNQKPAAAASTGLMKQ